MGTGTSDGGTGSRHLEFDEAKISPAGAKIRFLEDLRASHILVQAKLILVRDSKALTPPKYNLAG